DDVRSAVTLGSPVRFEERSFLEKLSRLGLRLKPVLVRVPRNYLLPYTARWSSFWMPYAPRFLADGLLNRDNVKTGTIRSAATVAVSKVSPRVLLNFADWIVNERWTSEDGSIDYRGGLSSVDVPTLVVVGGKDQLCPKRDVVPGYDEMSVDDKRLLVADDDRFREGYGHVDLVFGRRADEEIYPEVLEWLRDHPMERNTEGVSSQERGSKEADVT
ncbi:MAG: hypothetical protein SV760_03150, partial [Halobacteria archaeon]|nr:hypothetical protein [Halobacteria archaeon]